MSELYACHCWPYVPFPSSLLGSTCPYGCPFSISFRDTSFSSVHTLVFLIHLALRSSPRWFHSQAWLRLSHWWHPVRTSPTDGFPKVSCSSSHPWLRAFWLLSWHLFRPLAPSPSMQLVLQVLIQPPPFLSSPSQRAPPLHSPSALWLVYLVLPEKRTACRYVCTYRKVTYVYIYMKVQWTRVLGSLPQYKTIHKQRRTTSIYMPPKSYRQLFLKVSTA